MPLVSKFEKKHIPTTRVYLNDDADKPADERDYVLVRAVTRGELKEMRKQFSALEKLPEDQAAELEDSFTKYVVSRVLVKTDGSPMIDDVSQVDDIDCGLLSAIFDAATEISGLKKTN